MMEAQEEMDQKDAWDYNAEIKTILSKLEFTIQLRK